jgi:Protein of unknown function (DUF3277)
MTNPYTPNFGAYSFMDVEAILTGPHADGLVLGGPQSASAEEGITITFGEETNTQTIGADGSVMNSLHASRAGTATFRLLKTSPQNKALMEVYNFQRLQSNRWGRNHITVQDISRGDLYTLDGCAFVRVPTNSYAKIGNTIEWEFHVSLIDPRLGGIALMTSMGVANYQYQQSLFAGYQGGSMIAWS